MRTPKYGTLILGNSHIINSSMRVLFGLRVLRRGFGSRVEVFPLENPLTPHKLPACRGLGVRL